MRFCFLIQSHAGLYIICNFVLSIQPVFNYALQERFFIHLLSNFREYLYIYFGPCLALEFRRLLFFMKPYLRDNDHKLAEI